MTYMSNKRGDLTVHGLAMGYVQTRYSGKVKVTLSREHGMYHVRGVYYAGERKGDRHSWQTFNSLTEARKCFYEPRGKI